MNSPSSPGRDKYRALLYSASMTAGSDNWKTFAGRLDGPDNFVLGDAWRCIKLQFKNHVKPSVCPVCLEKPGSETDWYVTKSCKHAVCRQCLQEYASSLISDSNHSGPLKCPCCPRLLRVEDAMVALDKQRHDRSGSATKNALIKDIMIQALAISGRTSSRNKGEGLVADSGNERNDVDIQALSVLERWDNKVRNEMLRSMRDFRPCPHCSGAGNQSCAHSNNQGGGFVTPECLAEINDEREAIAERLLKLAGTPSAMATVLLYGIYYLHCSASESSIPNGGLTSVILQMASALIPSLLLPILPHTLGVMLALAARKVLLSPIGVICPCCHKEFNLEASSELQLVSDTSSGAGAEAATEQWKVSHTRPCPGCSSPIIKDGGCNHVRCGKCRVEFCWACMRTRTSCKAFQCTNGAPFGNAVGIGSLLRDQEAELTLVERIDRAEFISRRNLQSLRAVVAWYVAWISVTSVPLIGSLDAHRVIAALWRIVSLLATRSWYPIMYILIFVIMPVVIVVSS